MLQIRRIIQSFQNRNSIKSTVVSCGIARNTVRSYLKIIQESQLSFEALLALDDTQLNAIFFELQKAPEEDLRFNNLRDQLPYLKEELSKVGVTKQLLWHEYRLQSRDGYGYSQFCFHLGRFLQSQDLSMHFEYKPGEKLMLDFAGKYFNAVNDAGITTRYPVFIATLPFSGFSSIEAVENQKQGNFLYALESALIFIGGVPRCLIPDNLKSGVAKADRYEPKLTELMDQFCLHYNTTMMPARVREPRDKPHVEKAVHLAYERVFAPLRNMRFNSLEELNMAIRKQLEIHHNRPFRNSSETRKMLFEEKERHLLGSLPACRLEVKQTIQAKVQKNYHILLGQDGHFYSVPFEQVGKYATVHYDERTVEIYVDGNRVAIHPRNKRKYAYNTLKEHMPERHQHYHQQKGWDAEFFCRWACGIGTETEEVIRQTLSRTNFIEQNYNACLGILRLAGKYTPERLTAACVLALRAKAISYRFISNVLKNNTDKRLLQETAGELPLFGTHENIRGAEAYQ